MKNNIKNERKPYRVGGDLYTIEEFNDKTVYADKIEINHLKINNDEYIPLKKSEFKEWLYIQLKEKIATERENKLNKIKVRLFTLCFLSVIPALFILITYNYSVYVSNYTFFGAGLTISIMLYLLLYKKINDEIINGE